jgi:fatty-acyl-CoA synthase
LPGVAHWIETGAPDTPDFAISMPDLSGNGDGAPLGIERSPDDLLFIYTGGTTGMPKGVMWPHGNLREVMVAPARAAGPVPETLAELTAFIAGGGHAPCVLPAPPLMHGTGLIVALNAMLFGGTVVMLAAKTFDPAEMLRATETHRPGVLVIVGDSFARPLLDALLDHPDRYDLSSVGQVLSSGVIWSLEVKRGLLRFMPGAVMADSLGSSEALGLASSTMTADQEVHTARFTIGPRCRVLAEDGSWVEPGSGIPGMLAIGPPNPIGYYKDKAKSDATLPTIDGQRYCIPGDWCVVEADGSLTFLGRGSGCINTGGEKVFPEEVEEALKTHDAVADALVVGAPDAKWGQAIVAVVELRRGAALNVESLRSHVRSRLAGYKVPKDIVCATEPLRAANGKADYATARAQAINARSGAA